MIQLGSIVKIVDKSGVVLGQCVKVLGQSTKRCARINEVFLVTVKWLNTKRFSYLKPRKQKFFAKGTLHRTLLIRSKVNFRRLPGLYLKFNENAGIFVNRRGAPASRRIHGPVLFEVCEEWPWVGCIVRATV